MATGNTGGTITLEALSRRERIQCDTVVMGNVQPTFSHTMPDGVAEVRQVSEPMERAGPCAFHTRPRASVCGQKRPFAKRC